MHRHKQDHETNNGRKMDHIDYVVIKTGGKSVRSESKILTKNSSVIQKRVKEAETFRNSRENETGPGVDICSEWLYGKNKDELELEFPNLKYRDVKKSIKFLGSIDSKDELSSK